MAFTYTYDLAGTPRDRVRWESSDTGEYDSAGNLLGYFNEDEELDALLGLHSNDWQLASLAAIRGIIGKLSRPVFQADWLKVDPTVALKSYRALLDEKTEEYGVDLGELRGWFESGSVDVTRSDVTDWEG